MILGIALTWGTIVVFSCLGWQLLRQNGRILLRLDELEKRLDELEFGESDELAGLTLGSEAPAFELPDLSGGRTSLAQLLGQPVLLIFFNPDCGFCREMMPGLAGMSPHPAGRGEAGGNMGEGTPRILVLSTGDVKQNRQLFAEHKVDLPVLLQQDGEIASAYQANGTPSGYLIGADGKLASALVMGAEALLALADGKVAEVDRASASNGEGRADRFKARSLATSKIKRDGLKAGASAPDFQLPRLDGKGDLSLSGIRGKRVLLVFSSPGCGPCNTLAPELERFHRQHPEMELVMISKGEPQENRKKVKEYGLTFPIVLQQQWEISRRYAMFATPIAYEITEAGIIAHDVAVGTDAILEMLASLGKVAVVNRARDPVPAFAD